MARLVGSHQPVRVEGAVGFFEYGTEEGTQGGKASGIDADGELDKVPDCIAVVVGVIWCGKEGGEEDFFDDCGCAGQEAEGEDEDQGYFGLDVDVQSPDDWDWKDSKEKVSDDVDCWAGY